MADSCGDPITVTVTQTILQGAATSTTNALLQNLAIATDQGNPPVSALFSSSAIAFGALPSSLSSGTTLITTAPATTLTLSLISATPSTLVTISAKTTSGVCTKSTSKPTSTASSASYTDPKPSTTPPGIIAGGVLGSFAGLALVIALLLWCCRRKRKITFKRKVTKSSDQEEQLVQELGSVKQEMAQQQERVVKAQKEATVSAGAAKPLPSPRSFDFGLPKIYKSTSPVMPQKWI